MCPSSILKKSQKLHRLPIGAETLGNRESDAGAAVGDGEERHIPLQIPHFASLTARSGSALEFWLAFSSPLNAFVDVMNSLPAKLFLIRLFVSLFIN